MPEQVLPQTMRAMVLEEFGGDFHLEERPVPRPAHGEVLVRVLAVGAGVRLRRVEPLIGAVLPLERLNESLELARSEQVPGRIVLQVAEEIPDNGAEGAR